LNGGDGNCASNALRLSLSRKAVDSRTFPSGEEGEDAITFTSILSMINMRENLPSFSAYASISKLGLQVFGYIELVGGILKDFNAFRNLRPHDVYQ
jgi:hypothetical protein